MKEEYLKDLKKYYPLALIVSIITGIAIAISDPKASGFIVIIPIVATICWPLIYAIGLITVKINSLIFSIPFLIIEFISRIFTKK